MKESARLQSSKLLTLLQDGWEDRLKRSIYGVVGAGVNMFPVIMSLHELTGERGNADKCVDIALQSLAHMGIPEGRNLIALTTDNPTTMQSFRRKFQQKLFWIIPLACFLHSLNTLVGEICSYPVMKKIISKANQCVTFFNGSHYWGGQLKEEAKRLKITRGLKKNYESRWYALILLCVSVTIHRQVMSIICLRPDAQKKQKDTGSPVSVDVITTVLKTPNFWPLLNQIARITKPIVDAIGNCESRDTTLADCMLELIRCARIMGNFELEDDEDAGFLAHAKATFDRRFKYIATPIHWLALFLHPLCRKLAVSETAHGHNLEFMVERALKLAQQWRWTEHKARQLAADLKVYYYCKAPFSGGSKDAKGWWEDVPAGKHEGIRSLGIILASIVPHSADVERLFSDLGQTQTPHRNGMTVDHMEKYGKIRARLTYELHERQTAISGTSRRQHNHMHTRPTRGIDGDLAKDLENPITWIPPLREDDTEQLNDEDIVEKAFQDLQKTVEEEGPITSETSGSVVGGEIVNFEELACIDNGGANLVSEDIIDVVGEDAGGGWTIQELMNS
ncbi:ribonuclease H-like domain-containing protein [Mycena olivaceomarginata]|nr:ribonuclease H-like domain-containing protein [Mycena olivaceomarginata]